MLCYVRQGLLGKNGKEEGREAAARDGQVVVVLCGVLACVCIKMCPRRRIFSHVGTRQFVLWRLYGLLEGLPYYKALLLLLCLYVFVFLCGL